VPVAATAPDPPVEPPPAVGFDRPADTQATRDALAEIERDAALKNVERRSMAAALNDPAAVQAQSRTQAALARRDLAPGIARRDFDLRHQFHDVLRASLGRPAPIAAAAVLQAMARFREEPSKTLERQIANDGRIRSRSYLTNRAQRIRLLRSYGLSEPAILSDLIVVETSAQEGSRAAHLSREQAILRAARQLLAVPLPAPEIAAAQAAQKAAVQRLNRPSQ
jgi:hypothetical protein